MFKQQALSGEVSTTTVQDHFELQAIAKIEEGQDNAHDQGIIKAKFRERVRRAGRRVVVFSSEAGQRFECIQHAKVVEPSFAKGEWAVRAVRGGQT